MEVIVDSSFIISCMKRKIDFISQLEELGLKVVIPREVLQEIKDLKAVATHGDKAAIDLALQLVEKRKVKKVGIGTGKVDEHLIKLGQEGKYIATLDGAIKKMVPNKVIISDAKNMVVVERG
jgi:rRNA-processing protein FCF1